MKKYIIALILGFSAMVQAQNKISGTVTDAQNLPIPSVSVYAPDLHKSTITDSNGYYEIKSIPTGKLKISFSYVGFTSQNKIIAITDNETQLNVLLVILWYIGLSSYKWF